MDKKMKTHDRIRLIIQAASFAFHNGYINGWLKGKLYTGQNKRFCMPGLNCYSCPGAIGACPIGSLQAVLGNPGRRLSLYVLGFIGMVGILCGRLVCGWLCPFGFIQDLLNKIPLFKKTKTLPGHKYLKYLKYAVLVVMVLILPFTVRNVAGMGSPWFCEWICPSGTLLGGIPTLIANGSLWSSVGVRFVVKMIILIAVLVGSIKVSRPFCKYLCPLGAIYGLCNPVSTYRLKIDNEKCVSCGACQKACPMDILTCKTPNSPECIRCGRCVKACPAGAIESTWESLLKVRETSGDLKEPEITKETVIRRVIAAVPPAACAAVMIFMNIGTYFDLMKETYGETFADFSAFMMTRTYVFICSAFLIALSVKLVKSLKGEPKTPELREFIVVSVRLELIILIVSMIADLLLWEAVGAGDYAELLLTPVSDFLPMWPSVIMIIAAYLIPWFLLKEKKDA